MWKALRCGTNAIVAVVPTAYWRALRSVVQRVTANGSKANAPLVVSRLCAKKAVFRGTNATAAVAQMANWRAPRSAVQRVTANGSTVYVNQFLLAKKKVLRRGNSAINARAATVN